LVNNESSGPYGGTVLTPLLLTPEQAATELGVGRTRMYALLAGGDVSSVKIGRSRRVPRAALQEYIDRLVTHPQQAGSAA
jgi:excisionase family DNA binding protein